MMESSNLLLPRAPPGPPPTALAWRPATAPGSLAWMDTPHELPGSGAQAWRTGAWACYHTDSAAAWAAPTPATQSINRHHGQCTVIWLGPEADQWVICLSG